MYRIFLVEDDPIIAQTVQKHLESWGWQVKAAAGFSDVMADFIAFDPQLVLLDIGLPVYNGFHWCGEIRKVSQVPVIFLSSASDNMNIVMAMHMGGDDFIPKPFDLNVLTAKAQPSLTPPGTILLKLLKARSNGTAGKCSSRERRRT